LQLAEAQFAWSIKKVDMIKGVVVPLKVNLEVARAHVLVFIIRCVNQVVVNGLTRVILAHVEARQLDRDWPR
jgi:hypothetical protein